ncbi:MAG TPA: aminotransferase class I/II-fold pyridoxal phosphate-dependent enzyme [Streptosporangiaceae bacterium]|nr:aminotransferase class I/II-fold pyridoxal phosphate-dependent enzyme [Streptosporangiaceae bacterium]
MLPVEIAEVVTVPVGAKPLAYNSLWQLRNDTWCSLEESTTQLALADAQQRPVEQLVETVTGLLDVLGSIERFWAFPGAEIYREVQRLFAAGQYSRLAAVVGRANRALVTESYRGGHAVDLHAEDDAYGRDARPVKQPGSDRPYFEVLIVEDLTEGEANSLREELRRWRRSDDQFIYDIVVVPSFDDALLAARLNFRLQACVVRRRFAHRSRHDSPLLAQFAYSGGSADLMERSPDDRAQVLARSLARIRPELDLYLMTEISVEDLAARLSHHFRRIFHTREGSLELHLSILDGVSARYRAPFFSALRSYSQRPTGVFHALPISRGKSIVNSHWIKDMVDFYGLDIFLAETSATCGGLDSLLEPTGPLREAQQLAATTFGSRQTYFVTNGTSTANKIVVQALVRPGDIVLVDRNCHQSHHYGLMLAGAMVTYLEAYPLNEYSMYGAVPLREIKRQLLALRRAGKLGRVKMLLLTNCTFDGIVYDVGRVMEECLAIKPDLVFLWDEAWFAFARFHPVYRPRTAMRAARTLAERLRLPELRDRYDKFAEEFGPVAAADDEVLLDRRLTPDPARARVRVYSTQSTHKTLTSLRQGSMIHVWDQDFTQKAEETFHEAYMTHTSTSPNYQILASLDLGRRQAALEGFELVVKQIESAMRLRDAVNHHPLLSRYMRCLTTADLIPAEYRPTGIDRPVRSGLADWVKAWETDEFVLDPSRVTIFIGATGIDGDHFKRRQLMDRFGVQINKTSRNTVLFMTTIGTTRSSVAYLIEVLVTIARDLEAQLADMSPTERAAHERAVLRLTAPSAPLPDFSGFHPSFQDANGQPTPEGDIRRAFYLSYDDSYCEYLTPEEAEQRVEDGEQVVSTTYVTPYPPGYPVLVPGQVFSREILAFMRSLDTPEIHGYRPDLGYRVYVDKALEIAATPRPAPPPVTRE